MKLISKTKLNNGKYEYYLAGTDSQGFYIQLINTASDDDKDVLILSEFSPKTYTEPFDIEGFQDFNRAESVPTTLKADFYNLTGKVFDQYGLEIDLPVEFSIEGTSARIEDGEIIEDVVDNDTSYFIVAKYGDLEERQERFLYAPVEPPVSEMEILETKLKASTDRQDFLEELIAEMAMMLYE